MTKKIFSIFIIIFTIFTFHPTSTFAERLISEPSIITLDTAPHSAKPVSKKKKSTVKRNLKLGSKGQDVTTLQNFLIKKATGPKAQALKEHKANGVFGQLTLDALKEFQEAKGLPADGVAGARVRALYNK